MMFDVLLWIYIHDGRAENILDHDRNSTTFGIPCICVLEGTEHIAGTRNIWNMIFWLLNVII